MFAGEHEEAVPSGRGSIESSVAHFIWFALVVIQIALVENDLSSTAAILSVTFVLPFLVLGSFLSIVFSRLASSIPYVSYAIVGSFVLFGDQYNGVLDARNQTALLILSGVPAVWLSLWAWREQFIVFSVMGVVATGRWIYLAGPSGLAGTFIFIAASAASIALSRVRLRYRESPNINQEINLPLLLLNHAWPTTAFQAGILLTFSFSKVVLSRPSFEGANFHLYSLTCVLIGALVLVVVEERFRRRVLFGMTAAVGAMVCVDAVHAQNSTFEQVEIFLTLLSLVLLHLSTLSIPWGVRWNLLLAWLFAGYGFVVAWSVGYSVAEMAPTLALLTAGLAASLALCRVIDARRTRHLADSRAVSARLESGFSVAPKVLRQLSPRSLAREGISSRRFEMLLPTLLIAGVFATVVSIALTDGLTGLHLGFVSFYVLWGSMFYISRRRSGPEPLWFVAALSALLLFLWICALIALSKTQDPIWLLLPISVLVVCGFIPWRSIEIVPLLVASVVIGTTTAYQVGELRYGLFFVAAAILSWYLAASTFRKIKERFLLQEFQQTLRGTRTVEDTLFTLADYLGALFGDSPVLVAQGTSSLEIVAAGTVYPIDVSSFDVRRLSPRRVAMSALERYVHLGICNWIGHELQIESADFGSYTAEHALLIEIESIRERIGFTDSGNLSGERDVEMLDTVRVVVPTEFPIVRFFLGDELYLAEALAGEALLRLRSFAEEILRTRAERAAFSIQADRDYELSSLVHDINNTVQDQALLCDGVIEDLERAIIATSEPVHGNSQQILQDAVFRVKRIAVSSRAMAAVVSDAKRKRELDRLEDLHPRELLDVQEILQEAYEFARVRSERRRVEIRREVDVEEALMVMVSSRDHLETALRSLLNNAIAVSAPGSSVLVRVRSSAEWIWVDVQDTGPGLSQEERRALLRGEVIRHWGGTDLGFAQLRRFAEAQGGSLDVTSVGAGKGSLFTLLFPRKQVAKPVDRLAWVLVVDDDQGLVQSYARIIKALHLEPVIASTLKQACEFIDGRSKPSLLITDLNLGLQSGTEVIAHLRARYGKSIPVLIVSGVDDEQVLEKLRRDEECSVLTKPVGQRLLFSRLEELLKQRKLGSGWAG